MALTFLLAAKQIVKFRVDLKRIGQLNSKLKQNVKNVNVFRPQQIGNKCHLTRPSEAVSGKHIECIEIFVQRRRFYAARHYSSGHPQSENPPLPRILYLQNPFTWMINKFDLKVLEKAWDPTFSHREFIKGSKQAVCTVTRLIGEGRTEELAGLLTRAARGSLEADLRQSGARGARPLPLLALEPANIRVAAPRRVRFLKYDDRKFCDVDMMFVALKWVSPDRSDGLLYVEIFASFRREYTQYSIPEWTISYFKIIKLSILDR